MGIPVYIIGILVLLFTFPDSIRSEEQGMSSPVMGEIISIAEKTERYLQATGATVSVLGRDEITALHAESITDALNSIASVHLTERGTPGSQADMAINGSSTEGVLVLVNGIRVHDPQTGHFALDIPVDISNVERIEVMQGGGSSVYGASASGGIVNIVTADPANSMGGKTSFGSYGTGTVMAHLSRGTSDNGVSLSLRSGRSDGYREASRLGYTGADISGVATPGKWNMKYNLGMIEKDFGAGGFYSSYPSKERTKTYQGGLHASRLVRGKDMLRIRLGGRGHADDFILIEDDPSYYRNTHYNRTYSAAAEYLVPHRAKGYVLFGSEAEFTGITSGSLGSHDDRTLALFGEITTRVGQTELSLTSRLDTGTYESAVFSPGLGMTVPFGNSHRLILRAERSFRAPAYTDRYYNSPANIGDPDLEPEYVSSLTAGFESDGAARNVGMSVFARRVANMIDWVRNSENDPWEAANHGQVATNGVELRFRQSLPYAWYARFQAMYLDQSVSRRAGTESKYSLNPLEHSVTAVLSGPVWFNIMTTVITRYEKPVADSSRAPVTLKFSRTFDTFTTAVSVRNVFNDMYEEIPELPAPGRWITMTIEVRR